jgi:hypothetical protein
MRECIVSTHTTYPDKLQRTFDALSSTIELPAAVPALTNRLISLETTLDDTLQGNQRVQRLKDSHKSLADLLGSSLCQRRSYES